MELETAGKRNSMWHKAYRNMCVCHDIQVYAYTNTHMRTAHADTYMHHSEMHQTYTYLHTHIHIKAHMHAQTLKHACRHTHTHTLL